MYEYLLNSTPQRPYAHTFISSVFQLLQQLYKRNLGKIVFQCVYLIAHSHQSMHHTLKKIKHNNDFLLAFLMLQFVNLSVKSKQSVLRMRQLNPKEMQLWKYRFLVRSVTQQPHCEFKTFSVIQNSIILIQNSITLIQHSIMFWYVCVFICVFMSLQT